VVIKQKAGIVAQNITAVFTNSIHACNWLCFSGSTYCKVSL